MRVLDFGADPETEPVCCYNCGQELEPDNRRPVWISGWLPDTPFITYVCADDPVCAENDEDVHHYKPVLVTCDGWLDEPDELRGLEGTPCREEFYASKDRPVCPACGYEHAFTDQAVSA